MLFGKTTPNKMPTTVTKPPAKAVVVPKTKPPVSTAVNPLAQFEITTNEQGGFVRVVSTASRMIYYITSDVYKTIDLTTAKDLQHRFKAAAEFVISAIDEKAKGSCTVDKLVNDHMLFRKL